MLNPRRAVCLLAVLVLACAPLALAQGTYTQIDYPGATYTDCWGINNAGDISGNYKLVTNGTAYGYLLSQGTYTSISYPGSGSTSLYGLNNSGQLVGYTNITGLGFVYDVQSNTFTDISNVSGGIYTIPISINDAGKIAGYVQLTSGSEGFILIGTHYNIVVPPGQHQFVYVYFINNSNELFGNAAPPNLLFEFKAGKYRRLQIPSGSNVVVFGSNSTGTALVGQYQPTPGTTAGFLYENGSVVTIEFPGASFTGATGVNDSNEVVGSFQDLSGANHGFTWTP